MATRNLIVALTSSAKGFSQGFQRARKEIGSFNVSVNKTNKGSMSQFSRRADAMVAGLGGIAAAVGGALVIRELGQAVTESVRAFAEFDDKLTQSTAIMGDLSTAMEDELAVAAREVGRTTRFAADEAAESFFFLASAGLDAEQSLAALPEVAEFAQAGMFDLATATDLLTDAQSALGLTVDDAEDNLENLGRVSDVLVSANTLANASVQQFSEALTNRAAAAARLVGVEVEEVVAVLAAFADQGIKGQRAGESFSIVLRDLQRAANDNADAFRQFGIDVFDQAGEIRPLADIIADLEGALGGLSDQQVRTTLTTLGFQERSIANLLTLVGTSDAIRDYESALRDAGGTTAEVADRQLQSLQGQLDLVKSAFDDVKIGIGEALAPAIEDQIPGLIDAVDVLGDSLVGSFERWGPAAVDAVGTILEGLARLPVGIAETVEVARGFSADFAAGLLEGLGPLAEIASLFTGEDIDAIINNFEQGAARAQEQARIWEVAGQAVSSALDVGAPTAAADALFQLRNEGLLARDAWETVTGQLRLSRDETEAVIRALQSRGVSRGFFNDIIDDIEIYREEATELERFQSRFPDQFADGAAGAEDFGEALEGIDTEEAVEGLSALEQAAQDTVDLFAEAPEQIETSIDELLTRAADRIKQEQQFQNALAVLASRGLDDLVRELQEAGPASLSIAEEAASNWEKGFQLEQAIEEEVALALQALETDSLESPVFADWADFAVRLADRFGDEFAQGILNQAGKITDAFSGVNPGTAPSGSRSGPGGIELRASGGPVSAMRPYIVGERGPELFVPQASGQIYPNGTSIGGGSTQNVTINVTSPEPVMETDIQRAVLLSGIARTAEVARI